MKLTVSTLKLTRGRNWNRCEHCKRPLRPEDRIFFEHREGPLWCSVRCAEASQIPLANVGK